MRNWNLLFMFGCNCIGPNWKVVSRWPKCIRVPGDVFGMNGLQVTASELERSGLLGHDAMSVVQAVRDVGHTLHVQEKISPGKLHDVISPKPKVSLRKYTVTWPSARVKLCFKCCSEHPGYSQCVLCRSSTQQDVSRSHKQEGGLQKCETLVPPPTTTTACWLANVKNCPLEKPIIDKLVKNFSRVL